MSFTFLFYKHIMFRKSCAKCHYANLKRPSDITLADFWGWEKTDPNLNSDDKGISLVLLNTEKGKEIFDKVRDRMNVTPADLGKCLQGNLCRPTEEHPKRDEFESDYSRKGFKYIYYKYGEDGWRYKFCTLWGKIKRKIVRI